MITLISIQHHYEDEVCLDISELNRSQETLENRQFIKDLQGSISENNITSSHR